MEFSEQNRRTKKLGFMVKFDVIVPGFSIFECNSKDYISKVSIGGY
jgi:hypothetical protein